MTSLWVCSNGHKVRAPSPPTSCPAVVKGSPCRGELAPAKSTDLQGGLRWPRRTRENA